MKYKIDVVRIRENSIQLNGWVIGKTPESVPEFQVTDGKGKPMEFKLHAPYAPTGDQPQAIETLTEGVRDGIRTQVLIGVTGSGKTFTMANVIKNVNRPTLVIAHNKTLAAQLCNEFREFFPENRVEYFVSYYDYYQPESYVPSTDTYIEKDLSMNDEIDKLRNSATCALMERKDVIVVASVSCIYGLGAPEEYFRLSISLRPGMEYPRDAPVSCFAVDSGIYKDVARSLSDAVENEIADCSYL